MRAMHSLVLLLLLAAPEDLTPRGGAGWAGLSQGTWVRMKQTTVKPGRMLTPTISRITLAKADAKLLSFESTTENALGAAAGVAGEVQKWTVGTTGDAWPGETEKVEGRGEEAVKTAGREFLCDKVESIITGPTGKRVVTKWIARDPKVLAKRVTVSYGTDDKETSRETLILSVLAEERELAGKKIRCVKYELRRTEPGYEWEGVAYLSREVPTGLVWSEEVARQGGEVALTRRIEIIEFGTK
jgi:hypothetical protein